MSWFPLFNILFFYKDIFRCYSLEKHFARNYSNFRKNWIAGIISFVQSISLRDLAENAASRNL